MSEKKSSRMQHIANEQRGCEINPKCTHVFNGLCCQQSCRPGGQCFKENKEYLDLPPKKRNNKAKK